MRHLTENGVREVVLIAQDSTEYGRDLYGAPKLSELLREIVKVPKLQWVRTLYSYPKYFSDELIETIASEPKICKYVDLPLQHAHDAVLRSMRRPDTQEEMRALIKKLRERIPGVTIRSTFIVGFPGETDAQYHTLRNFIEEMRLDKVGVFTYSREEGTPAYDMPNQVPEEIMQERYHDLMSCSARSRSRSISRSRARSSMSSSRGVTRSSRTSRSAVPTARRRRSTARSTSRTTRTASRATSCACASCRASPTTSSASASTMAMPVKQGRRQRNEQKTS